MTTSETKSISGKTGRRFAWRLIGVAVFTFCLSNALPAHALKMMERDQIFFYFPEAESDLAQNLVAVCGGMTVFLADRGLPPTRPLHVILDDALDEPKVKVEMYPHREIRIPLRAPGVLEDGFLESDPWRYFLFIGLSMQGLYAERSAIPGGLHHFFGEIISPNLILPDWIIDGVSHLLYEEFEQRLSISPLHRTIMRTGPIPALDKVSNHPEIWPGRLSYQIYGRPFIRWLHDHYGWNKLYAFLRIHGAGIAPIEIDRKVKQVFGEYPVQLWNRFKDEVPVPVSRKPGLPLTGYWPQPFVYWNDTGVYPGLVHPAVRGRYGYVDKKGWLWLSRYEKGVSQITREHKDILHTARREHVWDPGPGSVAVTRKGRKPYLVLNTPVGNGAPFGGDSLSLPEEKMIAGPTGVLQFSGPVKDARGRIAVAGNTGGNWDIWLYDGTWHRLTSADSIELDPWFSANQVIFSSNSSGSYQLHATDMRQLTHAGGAVMLPRFSNYLHLGSNGWIVRSLPPEALPSHTPEAFTAPVPSENNTLPSRTGSDYSPIASILPNYLAPDLFIDSDHFQAGLATKAEDVSGFYAWDGGVRYNTDDSEISWRLGGRANGFSARATHYRFGYAAARNPDVDEKRYDMKVAWSPLRLKTLETGVNWRYYTVEETDRCEQEWWGSLNYALSFSNLNSQITLDWFSDGSQSLYGELLYWFGQEINTAIRLQAGKTWGGLNPGHNSFRIGGSTGEGFFTQRTSRLFPVRGFDDNSLDAGQAAAASLEIFWPLARLQMGYHTLPLFLHNISVGTFVDGGFAAEHPDSDDMLVSAGFELITGMELAWGFMANFRLGWAWPLCQPDDLDQEGPVFLIQIGRPL